MKTQSFLRFSLLIPFLVWVLCLAFFLIAAAIQNDNTSYGDAFDVMAILAFVSMLYVFGIMVWIFPYLLLAAILFFWSFIAQSRVALRVFALSPLVMTIFTVATLNIMMLWNSGDISSLDESLINMNLMAIGFALVWGYICVGIGYGIYKLLQHRDFLREEQKMEPVPQSL